MKVAIVGAGGMGRVHAAKYASMPDVELLWLDRDPERTLPHGRRATEDEALTADVVDVCLPTDLHREWGERAMIAGAAVFMEKPLARTLEDGLALVETSERTGRPLMPGHVVRFFAEYEAAHRMVRAGRVGEVATARLRRGGGMPKGTGWFADPARSGGVLLDLAVHDFDWLLWTFGPVERVTARAASLSPNPPATGDHAVATLRHASGVLSHVEATWMDPGGFRTEIEVAGREAVLEWDSSRTPPVRTVTSDSRFVDGALAPSDDPYYRELRGFLDAVASGTPPPVTAREGLAALRVALAAVESARRGGEPVTLR